jgi:hypothetical protein
MSRMWVETAVERTSVVVAPARSAEWWAHLVASAITVVGIVVVTAPLLMLPLRSGEAMLRLGLGFLFFICILRLCYQGIWAVAGRERFEVTPSGFTVRATWFGLGRARTYPLGFVTNIRPRDRVSRSTRRGKKRILARSRSMSPAAPSTPR